MFCNSVIMQMNVSLQGLTRCNETDAKQHGSSERFICFFLRTKITKKISVPRDKITWFINILKFLHEIAKKKNKIFPPSFRMFEELNSRITLCSIKITTDSYFLSPCSQANSGKCVRVYLTVCIVCQTFIDPPKDPSKIERNDITCKITYCSVGKEMIFGCLIVPRFV